MTQNPSPSQKNYTAIKLNISGIVAVKDETGKTVKRFKQYPAAERYATRLNEEAARTQPATCQHVTTSHHKACSQCIAQMARDSQPE